jgi:hypothetical protein
MKKNMGLVDKIVRIILAIVIAMLYYFNIIGGILAVILFAFAILLVITSFISFCPMYVPLNVSTIKKEE